MIAHKQLMDLLNKRFVDDNKLPIDVFFDEDIFRYFLLLYEEQSHSFTKYNQLIKIIEERFNGNPQLFLNEYYDVRERMITDILNNDEYKKFNDSNYRLNEYDLPTEAKNYCTKSIYNMENDGKIFLSIDLSKANFSALKYHNSNILGCDKNTSYDEWVSKYTDLEYIKDSKYTRQVVFGKLNPSRQIKVEKYMIYKVLEYFKEMFDNESINFKIVSLVTDEVVFECTESYKSIKNMWDKIKETCEEFSNNGIPVKPTLCKIAAHVFESYNGGKLNIFEKVDLINKGKTDLKSVPSYFYAQVYKLLNGMDLNEKDLLFWHNDQPAKFLYPIKLVK